jgi:hypothetical protein
VSFELLAKRKWWIKKLMMAPKQNGSVKGGNPAAFDCFITYIKAVSAMSRYSMYK